MRVALFFGGKIPEQSTGLGVVAGAGFEPTTSGLRLIRVPPEESLCGG